VLTIQVQAVKYSAGKMRGKEKNKSNKEEISTSRYRIMDSRFQKRNKITLFTYFNWENVSVLLLAISFSLLVLNTCK